MVVFPVGPTPRELDCDWGSVVPESIKAFVVNVFIKRPDRFSFNEWCFIIMLPEIEDINYYEICRTITDGIVRIGDRFVIDPLAADTQLSGNSPVISYDPRVVEQGVISPFWLIPPIWMTS